MCVGWACIHYTKCRTVYSQCTHDVHIQTIITVHVTVMSSKWSRLRCQTSWFLKTNIFSLFFILSNIERFPLKIKHHKSVFAIVGVLHVHSLWSHAQHPGGEAALWAPIYTKCQCLWVHSQFHLSVLLLVLLQWCLQWTRTLHAIVSLQLCRIKPIMPRIAAQWVIRSWAIHWPWATHWGRGCSVGHKAMSNTLGGGAAQ